MLYAPFFPREKMFLSYWYPILKNVFGFSEKRDLESANILSKILDDNFLNLNNIRRKVEGLPIAVFGASPSLKKKLTKLKKWGDYFKIAADGAARALLDINIKPDIVVSDLDGVDVNDLNLMYNLGSYFTIHAHGDNISKIKKYPHHLISKTFGTTQTRSLHNVFNIGGFTDGDRALILAEYFNPNEILLVGMDFGNIVGEYSKRNTPYNHPAPIKKRLKLEFADMIVKWVKETSKIKIKIL